MAYNEKRNVWIIAVDDDSDKLITAYVKKRDAVMCGVPMYKTHAEALAALNKLNSEQGAHASVATESEQRT